MSAYQVAGNIQILIYTGTPSPLHKSGWRMLQVEEVILNGAPIHSVVDFLRQQISELVSFQISQHEEGSKDKIHHHLEASLTREIPEGAPPPLSKTDLAERIIDQFRDFFADSPPWYFNPLSEFALLDGNPPLDADRKRLRHLLTLKGRRRPKVPIVKRPRAFVLSQNSPYNHPGDGTALLGTRYGPYGDAIVFREKGYLRVSWTI
jgi:hypothetical protein